MNVKRNKKNNTDSAPCPVCGGKGVLPEPFAKHKKTKKDAVISLLGSGYTYRETMRLLGYKSPGSVQKVKKSHGKITTK